jgi:IS30 family transposase
MLGPGSGCAGRVAVGCWSTSICARWCRRSSSWSGVRNRSPPGCAPRSRDRPDRHLCHETIYQALYLGGRAGLRRQLTRRLRIGRPLRKRRRRATERQTRFVTPGRLIDQHHAVVMSRERIGDWEGDLVVGRSNRSAIATLVDRRSRYLHLVALPHGHDAAAVRDALIAALAQLPAAARHMGVGCHYPAKPVIWAVSDTYPAMAF